MTTTEAGIPAGSGEAGDRLVATKGDRTRRRLLDLAVARFAAEGYRRTSVSAIARDAGVTPAAVYAYFDGKEALFQAAVDADTAALIDAAHTRDPGSGTVQDRWLAIVDRLVVGLGDHPLARRVLSGLEADVAGRLLALPSLAALRRDLAADLRAAQRAGEVRADTDPDALATGLEALVLALLMAQIQTGLAHDDERALGILAVLDAALRAPADAPITPGGA